MKRTLKSSVSKRRPFTILVVDDDRDLVEMTARHLELSGHRALRAYDGMEAIRTAQQSRPDLILLDIMMPGLDGFQVCRFLKNHPTLERIPVFFMTARDGAGDRQRGLLRGGDDYLTKPLDFREVAVKIRRLNRAPHVQRRAAGEQAPEEELSDATAVRELGRVLDENLYRLSVMEEVSRAVADATTREEIVRVLLIGCLSDIGLGYDRALFLERTEDGHALRGFRALGVFPASGVSHAGQREALHPMKDRTLRELWTGDLARLPFLTPEKHPWLGKFILHEPGGKRRYDLAGPTGGEDLLDTARRLSVAAAGHLGSPEAQAIPVVAKGELTGALVVDAPFSHHTVSAEDRRNLLILCNQVGLALERTRLLDETRQQARELEHLSQMNANVVQAAGVGIVYLDPAGIVLAWNRAMARLAGVDAAQALGQGFLGLLPGLEGSLVERRLRLALTTGTPERVGHFPLTRGRKSLFLDLKMSPVKTLGIIRGVVLLVEDITRRVTLEEKNREILQHLSDIIHYSADAIVITDPRGRIRTLNRSATALLGQPEEKLRGKSMGFLFSGGEGKKSRAELLDRVSRGEADRDRETVLHAPGAERHHLSITATPIRRTDGGLRAISLVIRDITERKKLITQLVQTEKLASLGVIAAGMAHEINNPLTSISMHAELLALSCDLKPEAKDFVEKIIEEVNRISEIVGDLLVYSRSHDRARELVDISLVLRQAVTFIQRKTSADGIAVTLDQEGSLLSVRGRANEILEIFLNVLSNAADAVSREGTIEVRAAMVRGKEAGGSREQRLRVVIEDDGAGIAAADLPRIFDPFYTTKPPGKGTGLGLMVVRELVESSGGSVAVESRVGRGTTVTLELPCEAEGPPPSQRPR